MFNPEVDAWPCAQTKSTVPAGAERRTSEKLSRTDHPMVCQFKPCARSEDKPCRETSFVTAQIDRDCEVHRLYRKQNMGCGKVVSEAITWLFNQENEGIILEDDCLPNESFFSFCQAMLERYWEEDPIDAVPEDFFFPKI